MVLNLSLGTTTTDDEPPIALQAAVDEIEELAAASPHEALIVAAAGNYGEDRPVVPGRLPRRGRGRRAAAGPDPGAVVELRRLGDLLGDRRRRPVDVRRGPEDPEFDPVCPDTFGTDPFALQFGTSFAAPQVAARVARVAQQDGIGLRDALDRVLDGAPVEPGYGRVLVVQPAIGS